MQLKCEVFSLETMLSSGAAQYNLTYVFRRAFVSEVKLLKWLTAFCVHTNFTGSILLNLVPAHQLDLFLNRPYWELVNGVSLVPSNWTCLRRCVNTDAWILRTSLALCRQLITLLGNKRYIKLQILKRFQEVQWKTMLITRFFHFFPSLINARLVVRCGTPFETDFLQTMRRKWPRLSGKHFWNLFYILLIFRCWVLAFLRRLWCCALKKYDQGELCKMYTWYLSWVESHAWLKPKIHFSWMGIEEGLLDVNSITILCTFSKALWSVLFGVVISTTSACQRLPKVFAVTGSNIFCTEFFMFSPGTTSGVVIGTHAYLCFTNLSFIFQILKCLDDCNMKDKTIAIVGGTEKLGLDVIQDLYTLSLAPNQRKVSCMLCALCGV